jgi:hypothetical protein
MARFSMENAPPSGTEREYFLNRRLFRSLAICLLLV